MSFRGWARNVSDGQWILTANILPLAAFMVLGGRLGDLFGLRRVFLTGAVLFAICDGLGERRAEPRLDHRDAGGAGLGGGADDADRGRDHQRGLAAGASWLRARHPRGRVVVLRGVGAGAGRRADLRELAAGVPDQRSAGARGVALTLAGTPALPPDPAQPPTPRLGRDRRVRGGDRRLDLRPLPRAARRLAQREHGGPAGGQRRRASRSSTGSSGASPIR